MQVSGVVSKNCPVFLAPCMYIQACNPRLRCRNESEAWLSSGEIYHLLKRWMWGGNAETLLGIASLRIAATNEHFVLAHREIGAA